MVFKKSRPIDIIESLLDGSTRSDTGTDTRLVYVSRVRTEPAKGNKPARDTFQFAVIKRREGRRRHMTHRARDGEDLDKLRKRLLPLVQSVDNRPVLDNRKPASAGKRKREINSTGGEEAPAMAVAATAPPAAASSPAKEKPTKGKPSPAKRVSRGRKKQQEEEDQQEEAGEEAVVEEVEENEGGEEEEGKEEAAAASESKQVAKGARTGEKQADSATLPATAKRPRRGGNTCRL